MSQPVLRNRSLALLALIPLVVSMSGCALVVPWRLIAGDWREGAPRNPDLFRAVPDDTLRSAATKTLADLNDQDAGVTTSRIIQQEGGVVWLGSRQMPDYADPMAIASPSVFPLALRISWETDGLTRIAVQAETWQYPFRVTWMDGYDATSSIVPGTSFTRLRGPADPRTADAARRMREESEVLHQRLMTQVTERFRTQLVEVAR